jgi:D-3-phosphoglycerate dehydrogenase
MGSERLVFLRDSFSLLDAPEAVVALQRHALRPVTEVKSDRAGDVVAVIAGLGKFGVVEAEPYPALRTVARFGAGYDNVDVEGLWASRRVSVSYTPDVSSGEVAQFAFAMIILALRGAPRDIAGLSSVEPTWRVIGRGIGMSEATVGIVGCGHIGIETARLTTPLAAKTLLWNRTRREVALSGIDDSRYEVIQDLEELAARSDIVSVHLALTAQTRGMIGAAFFENIRAAGRSIALVNTARGNIVDEAALLDALEQGTVRDAAIDVWSAEAGESTELVRKLRRHPAVLPTSHIGAFTRGVQQRCALQCAQNIIAEVGRTASDGPTFIAAHAAEKP